MKYKFFIIYAVLTALVFLGCKGGSGSSRGEVNFDKDASYAIGLNIGSNLREGLIADGVYPNIDEFIKGMRDGITGREPRFDLFEARDRIEAAFDAMMEGKNADAIQEEIDFLAENARNPGIIITPSGLQYEVLVETSGPKPTIDSVVKVHYEGRLTDGYLFDNSYETQAPVQFPLSGVITGWAEGLQLMSVGSKYKLYIPSEMGYGPYGMGPIPPYATLIFTVELLEISEMSEFDYFF
ncbi:MAG: FKBP-type peptidyl-prolyl cis-trans isomerase [Treponema sp.]|nr:FKBP-type peptidyl-prolyl cis-trans isomerase [Treponema sp.]